MVLARLHHPKEVEATAERLPVASRLPALTAHLQRRALIVVLVAIEVVDVVMLRVAEAKIGIDILHQFKDD